MDWIVFSEDLPDPENRVTWRDRKVQLAAKRNNLSAHRRMVGRVRDLLRRCGYPLVLVKPLLRHSTSHQCGTVKFGTNPGDSALDLYCRSHQHPNLFVVDASFMPSSAAVNPALTIAAQALRAADHMLEADFGVTARAAIHP
jgi:choline dehydrogenase-like flavoprotein